MFFEITEIETALIDTFKTKLKFPIWLEKYWFEG